MLAGMDARQLSEMYAFASIEPLDEPLQRMIAEVSATLARVNGNQLSSDDFMLVPKVQPPDQEKALRQHQIVAMFAKAAKHNDNTK